MESHHVNHFGNYPTVQIAVYRFASPPLAIPTVCRVLVIECIVEDRIVEIIADDSVRFGIQSGDERPMVRKRNRLKKR